MCALFAKKLNSLPDARCREMGGRKCVCPISIRLELPETGTKKPAPSTRALISPCAFERRSTTSQRVSLSACIAATIASSRRNSVLRAILRAPPPLLTHVSPVVGPLNNSLRISLLPSERTPIKSSAYSVVYSSHINQTC